VRLVDVGQDVATVTIDGFSRLGSDRHPPRSQQLTLTGDLSQLIARATDVRSASSIRLSTAPRDTADGEKLLRAVAAAGAPVPPADQGIVFEFAASGLPTHATRAAADPWMVKTVLRLQQDEDLQRLARGATADSSIATAASAADARWTVLARDKAGEPIVTAAATDRELVVAIGAPVSSFPSAAAVRATLAARQGPLASPEAEVLRTPQATLTAWSRAPGPVDRDAWRRAERSDARWLWLVVFVLLIVEQWLRSRLVSMPAERETRAAA
jgi:hypothetical protein